MGMQPRLSEVRCARCDRAWSAHAWRALPKHRTLSQADVAAFVHSWPADSTVEVRVCPGCGTDIARRVYAGEASGQRVA
jgi:hypothetical protein